MATNEDLGQTKAESTCGASLDFFDNIIEKLKMKMCVLESF